MEKKKKGGERAVFSPENIFKRYFRARWYVARSKKGLCFEIVFVELFGVDLYATRSPFVFTSRFSPKYFNQ